MGIITKCEQEREDCFAYKLGGCTALIDTSFPYECPFYRTDIDKDEIELECKRYAEAHMNGV